MQKIIIFILIVIILGGVGFFIINKDKGESKEVDKTPVVVVDTENNIEEADTTEGDKVDYNVAGEYVIGTSTNGNDIKVYTFGNGETKLLFVGGIHGGYSWNTSLLAFELIDYLEKNPQVVPDNVQVTVMPVVNPDGLAKVAGSSGRFTAADVSNSTSLLVAGRVNANNVDLNRNFDCDWQEEGVWQNKTISGGSAAFSEPESLAVKNYVEAVNPTAVVVWYAAAGGVFSSNCHNGVLPETSVLTKLYAAKAGYKAYEEFGFYDITGDMVNWLAREKIPAISVLLTNHTDTEWNKNKAGIEAVIDHYAE